MSIFISALYSIVTYSSTDTMNSNFNLKTAKGLTLKLRLVILLGLFANVVLGNVKSEPSPMNMPQDQKASAEIPAEIQETMTIDLEEEQEHPEVDVIFKDEEMVLTDEEDIFAELEELDDPDNTEEKVENVTRLEYERALHECDLHKPLSCNANIADATCSSFLSLFNKANNANAPLIVPCGECYVVDITDGSQLDLPNGIRIEGKLHFPSSASVTLRTIFVYVFGVLKMDTPASGNKVKFSLFGEELQTYTGSNGTICDSGCNMGSKVIAVHGGQLDIQGVEDHCPAWEKLTDVGEGELRPFSNDLPCDTTSGNCWTTNTLELDGLCYESGGHTRALGKYTVYCPLKSTGVHIGSGERDGVKITGIGSQPFHYPSDSAGNTLSLKLAGSCSRAGHTNHFGKCVVQCPVERTAQVHHGFSGPLTFTSVAPPGVDPSIPRPYTLPDGSNLSLKIKSTCSNSRGHTRRGRCVIKCPLHRTRETRFGTSSNLHFTSRYVPSDPYPMPTRNGQTLKLKTRNTTTTTCHYMAGHTRAWGNCILRCPLEQTLNNGGGFHSASTLKNPATGGFVQLKRIIHFAHVGRYMYIMPDGFNTDTCNSSAVDALNATFPPGSDMEVFYPDHGISADGNNYVVDGAMHWAWRGRDMFFYPDDSDPDTCDQTAADFAQKFPAGYAIDVSHPIGPPAGQSFNVNRVHHWAWRGRDMFFFPEESDKDTCAQTARDFNRMFPHEYGINVSNAGVAPAGGVVTASQGVHHWSWRNTGFYFWPDVTADEVNAQLYGNRIQVSYLNKMDYYDIKVTPNAASCWEPGTELLLTSHTRSQNDQQVRTIESVNQTTGVIRLTSPISKPISLADHPDFAVEVASLNRRIVFEADSDADDEFIGGHLIVHHTNAVQTISGVEVKNFGQQGRLGKYPIHFHMCGNVTGSLVKKNVVRNSNQRCYVVHLSDSLTIEENVAYDTFGHCYFIEDGNEVDNTFRRNLGSGIKIMPAERVAMLEASSGRDETDDRPHGFNGASVFWISNPQNKFYGNVAAGGAVNGYWFETRGPRMRMDLLAFEDNEVHSIGSFAFTVYKPGWRPDSESVIKNLKVYRNPSWGAFLHVTKNLRFEGGLFADNGEKAVMFNRADDIVFNGTTFIGKTDFAGPKCGRREKVAISLNPARLQETVLWSYNGRQKGPTIQNCKFYNWTQADTECNNLQFGSKPFKFNFEQVFTKSMNAAHQFIDISVDSFERIDACMQGSGITDVSIEVVSDINKAVTSTGQPGFLVSPKVATMLSSYCTVYDPDGCLEFCTGACLRTITVLADDSSFQRDTIMIVADGAKEVNITRKNRGDTHFSNRFPSAYTVVLPKGTYTARFESISSPGTLVWPQNVRPVFEAAPHCANHIIESDLTFIKPTAERSECNQLIYNGNFDSGVDGWNGYHMGIEWLDTSGVNGGGALVTTLPTSRGNWPNQNLDVTCIVAGEMFDVEITYKIVDTNHQAVTHNCNDGGRCPFARAYRASFDTSNPANKREVNLGWETIVTSTTSLGSGWYKMHGSWLISQTTARADILKFHVAGSPDHIIIDNVSLQKSGARRFLRSSAKE